jgi:hypothetical protein
MRKSTLLLSISIAVLVFGGCTNIKSSKETTNNKSIVSNKTLTSEKKSDLKKINIEEAQDFKSSLNNGSVIMLSRDNSDKLEVYNIRMLDKFIESFNNHKEGYVRIIKGTLVDGKILVNKLQELESDGEIITNVGYDCYSNKDTFTPVNPDYFHKIGKSDTKNILRYTLCTTTQTPDSEGALLISFEKNSMKN